MRTVPVLILMYMDHAYTCTHIDVFLGLLVISSEACAPQSGVKSCADLSGHRWISAVRLLREMQASKATLD